MEDEELMSATEVIKVLRISRTTLRRFVDRKIIIPVNEPNPLLTRPKTLYFRKEDVLELLNKPKAD